MNLDNLWSQETNVYYNQLVSDYWVLPRNRCERVLHQKPPCDGFACEQIAKIAHILDERR